METRSDESWVYIWIIETRQVKQVVRLGSVVYYTVA